MATFSRPQFWFFMTFFFLGGGGSQAKDSDKPLEEQPNNLRQSHDSLLRLIFKALW